MRRITLFVSAMLMALFATLTILVAPTQAQTPTMATWSGEDIEYKEADWDWDISLRRTDNPANDNNVPDLTETPCRNAPSAYYSSIGTFGNDEENSWLYVICLSYPFDGSDKSQPIKAMFLQFDAPYGTVNARDFELDGSREVTIAAEGTDASGNPTDTTDDVEPTSSCSGPGTEGIGWIVCPMTKWLATGMDSLFNILEEFLVVSPLSTDRDGALYYMWGLMQNLANILFIVGFLIIIYSQITSFGLSNYGIKRLLPRLIVAAVLVNVSYWVVALAVDLSNLLGSSIHDMFTNIGDRIPANAKVAEAAEEVNWAAIATIVLSGGALGATVIGAGVGVVGTAGASLWFLLVALMGVMVSVLVAILVLAARQALITILIIVSPLAFVAYLLPSTEKYFERWRSLFMTLLLVFPIISVVFGGAQVAGLAIIYSALENPGNGNFYTLIILGMLVQVAPVIITPLLIKLSGSIVGRVAGIVNDPNKGLVDKTRKFAQTRHDMTKNRQLWDWDKQNGRYRNNNPLAAGGRRMALREIKNTHKLKAWESGATAAYEETAGAHEIYAQTRINEMRKNAGEDIGKAEFEHSVKNIESIQKIDVLQRVVRSEAEDAANKNKTAYEAMTTSPGIAPSAIRDLANRGHDVAISSLDEAQRQSSIHQEHESQYWNSLTKSAERQRYAGAPEIAKQGEARVANLAQQKQTEEREKIVGAGVSTINRQEITNQDKIDILLGMKPSSPRAANLRADFHLDIENRSAVIRTLDTLPQYELHRVMEELVNMTETANGNVDAETLRSELVGYLQSKRKPIWVSNTILNNMREGKQAAIYDGKDGAELMIKEEIFDKRGASAKTLVAADRDDLRRLANWVKNNKTYVNDTTNINAVKSKKRLQEELIRAYKDSEYAGDLEKKVNELDDLWVNLGLGDKKRYELKDGNIIGL